MQSSFIDSILDHVNVSCFLYESGNEFPCQLSSKGSEDHVWSWVNSLYWYHVREYVIERGVNISLSNLDSGLSRHL